MEKCSHTIPVGGIAVSQPQPIYTRDNCKFKAPLEWGVSVFWRSAMTDASWFAELAKATEPDGMELLGHRFSKPGVSQFVAKTLPHVTPLVMIQRLKGRLLHAVRDRLPRPLKRNYAVRSFGRVTRETIEQYVAAQLDHHRMADERVQAVLERFQIHQPEVDLSRARQTSHAIYWYNLHIVLVHRERWNEIRAEVLEQVREMILSVCLAKRYWLSRAGILTDHVHLALGCPIEVAPADVAVSFLNNLASVHGMRPVFQFGAYVATFGEYTEGAIETDLLVEDRAE